MDIQDPRLVSALQSTPMVAGRYTFLSASQAAEIAVEMTEDINALKTYLKRFRRLYVWLAVVFSPAASPIPHLTAHQAIKRAFRGETKEKLIINLGSGVKDFGPDVVEVDVHPYDGVQVVADAAKLPFKDASVDMVLCESTLEHVPNPYAVIEEIKRVLKPGGYVYITVPFLYPFHSSPDDFVRFTKRLLTTRLSPLTIEKEGICGGPMAALQGVLMHVFAILFSFGSRTLYLSLVQVFMVLCSPLKIFDLFFFLFPYAHEAASDVYVFARK